VSNTRRPGTATSRPAATASAVGTQAPVTSTISDTESTPPGNEAYTIPVIRGTATTVDEALVSPADQFNEDVITRVPAGESETKPADAVSVTVTDSATADASAGTLHVPSVTFSCHVNSSTAA
jgi:hypothetical protein